MHGPIIIPQPPGQGGSERLTKGSHIIYLIFPFQNNLHAHRNAIKKYMCIFIYTYINIYITFAKVKPL